MGLLGKAKDVGLRVTANHFLHGIGELKELAIDRQAKRLTCELALEGEAQTVELAVDGWELDDRGRARVLGVRCSRRWVEELALRTVAGHWFDVPPEVLGKLRFALGD